MSAPAERSAIVGGHRCRIWEKGEGEPLGFLGGLRDRADFREAYYLAKGPRRGFYVRKDALEKLVDDELAFEDLETGRRIPRPLDRDPGPAHDANGPSPEEP